MINVCDGEGMKNLVFSSWSCENVTLFMVVSSVCAAHVNNTSSSATCSYPSIQEKNLWILNQLAIVLLIHIEPTNSIQQFTQSKTDKQAKRFTGT